VPRLRRGGFTVLELLLVLVVLGVMAGSVVVSLSGRHRTNELETASRDLATALRYAHQNASLTQEAFRVVIAPQEAVSGHLSSDLAITVEIAEDLGRGLFRPARGMPGRPHALPKGVYLSDVIWSGQSLVDEPYELAFGSDAKMGWGQLQLSNEQGERIEIEVASLTGQVTVSGVKFGQSR